MVAFHINTIELPNLFEQVIAIAVIVKYRAIFKPHVVEGVKRHQRHVILSCAVTQFKEFMDQVGSGNDGGTSIEGEAILLIDIGTTTGFIPFFCDRHLMPLCL